MSITNYYSVTCACGNKGKIKVRENDTPYSGDNWEKFSLEGLNGGKYSTSKFIDWETAFSEMKPQCPKCNRLLTAANLDNQ